MAGVFFIAIQRKHGTATQGNHSTGIQGKSGTLRATIHIKPGADSR